MIDRLKQEQLRRAVPGEAFRALFLPGTRVLIRLPFGVRFKTGIVMNPKDFGMGIEYPN